MKIKLKALEETRSFYKVELKKRGLTGKKRKDYLKALKSIEKIIREERKPGKKLKHKKFIAYDHKAVFQNSRKGY
ncbi:hypothetical protein ES695_17925 [Candidatus Atribacteria bacterium 1244-E10-H5-B2]|nr:MAG: hypothetical protein ES695_17925 [Candidatus Atribacteria bacterium 1244-E10-H5-B2]